MKLFKNIPLMAFVFGLGLMVTMMSFTNNSSKVDDVTYGYDISNPLAPWIEVGTEGYTCLPVTEKVCTYTFEETNPPVNTPTPTPREDGTEVDSSIGSYQFVED